MKKVIAWLPAWALFWIGDLACRVLNRIPDWEARPARVIARWLYVVYNRCMLASCDLNDWAGLKIWTREGLK
jgi:hypothetical protein